MGVYACEDVFSCTGTLASKAAVFQGLNFVGLYEGKARVTFSAAGAALIMGCGWNLY